MSGGGEYLEGVRCNPDAAAYCEYLNPIIELYEENADDESRSDTTTYSKEFEGHRNEALVNEIRKLTDGSFRYFEGLYQDFHKYPELAHYERRSSIVLAGELRDSGFEVTEDFAGHGVVAVFYNGEGPTALIRTDMDALPIQEETGLAYQSLRPNVMHACGHDVHMSVFLGAAYALTELADQWQGTLVMIGQPAEETGKGAKAMIDEGLFELFPMPDYALSLHVSSSKPVGTLTHRSGYSLASVDYVDLKMYVHGGHGAMPHATVSPIELAAQFVLGLKTFLKEVNRTDPAVVSVGSFSGGSGHNIIPGVVDLQMTSRSYGEEVRERLKSGILSIAREIAKEAGAPEPKMHYREGVPSLYNEPELVDESVPIFESVVGKNNVFETSPKMFGEDFAFYGFETGIPIFQFGLGSQPEDKTTWQRAHSSKYAPQFEEAFKLGVQAMTGAVIKLQSSEYFQ